MRRCASVATLSISLSICLGLFCAEVHAQNWPRFRGPGGAGISDLKGVPTSWTEKDYEWTIDLPGIGRSSPVVWEKRLYVTNAEEGNRSIYCLDADTSKELWRRSVTLGKNHLHAMNSYASGTPAVDADRVYVPFADADHYLVNAYTHEGELEWSKDLGPCATEHGHGVSPVLYENLVIIANDQAKPENGAAPPSAVIALNRTTGEIVWHQERKTRDASYATPIVITPEGAPPQLIVVSGACGISALDLMTGDEIWSSGELPKRTVGSPVYSDGLLFTTCGQGGKGELLVCVDASGKGDVSQTHVRYTRKKEIPYVPTPIVRAGVMYLWNDDGTFFAVDAATGNNIARQRIGGSFFASPVMIDGKLYCVSHNGEIVVVDSAAPEYKLLGRSPLGDESYSSPAVGNGRVYFRGFKRLASLKAKS